MKNKLSELILVVLVASLMAGCGAVQYPGTIQAIDPGTTIRGMQAALSGTPGTYILQLEGHLIMGWPMGSQYAWVAFTPDGKLADTLKTMCGNRACPEAMADIYNFLINRGWQSIPAGMVPPAVGGVVRQMGYLLSIGASLPMTPVLLMPAMIDPIQLINPDISA